MRSELQRLLEAPRSSVFPEALLVDLLPAERRREAWRRLSDRLSWRLPELVRPRILETGLPTALLSLVPIALIGGAAGLLSGRTAWILGLAAIPAVWGLYHLTAPLAVHLPDGCATVGAAAKEIVRLNFGDIARRRDSWSEAEVWESLRALVVEQLGVPEQRVTAEARFVEDLGVD